MNSSESSRQEEQAGFKGQVEAPVSAPPDLAESVNRPDANSDILAQSEPALSEVQKPTELATGDATKEVTDKPKVEGNADDSAIAEKIDPAMMSPSPLPDGDSRALSPTQRKSARDKSPIDYKRLTSGVFNGTEDGEDTKEGKDAAKKKLDLARQIKVEETRNQIQELFK